MSKATYHPVLRQLGATIRSLRMQRKLSQEALADLATIDRSYMSGIERGLRNVSVLHAIRIANALQVSLADLLRLLPGDLADSRQQSASTGALPTTGATGSTPLSDWMTRLIAADSDGVTEVPMTVSAGMGRGSVAEGVGDSIAEWALGRCLSIG